MTMKESKPYPSCKIYLMGFTIIFRYNTRRLTVLSIRSSARKPQKSDKR